jgi:hypothetical protein
VQFLQSGPDSTLQVVQDLQTVAIVPVEMFGAESVRDERIPLRTNRMRSARRTRTRFADDFGTARALPSRGE